MSVRDKVVVVTGAASGMGAETAAMLAAAGARVVLCDRDEDGGHRRLEAIQGAGGDAAFVPADVSREDDVRDLIAETVRRFGRLDAAVNNAAITPDTHPLDQLDMDEFDRVLAVNLRGVALCLKYELAQLYRQGGPGSIVNLGSIRSFRPRLHNAGYVASKHAILGLTKVAALEAAEHGGGIRVNTVAPGAIETPMFLDFMASLGTTPEEVTPELSLLGRLGTPSDVARAVLWLCSDESSYVTGIALPVDGGYLAR
jgi:NAD(P)-dependent dehydrogenase (short-subunit alcohol dehydrogenase family)